MTITVGKARRLARLTDDRGIFSILAIDHRDSLRAVVSPHSPESVGDEQLIATKLAVLRSLADVASGVMLDPVYGVAPAIATGALPADTGFMTALESQGYLGDPESRDTTLLPDWSVEKAARVGADAVKLLIFYHPDSREAASRQQAVVESVVSQCESYDIPLFLEPMLYRVAGGRDPVVDRRALVVETAKELCPIGADVMKVQFPVSAEQSADRHEWIDSCIELDETMSQPWAILSGGEPIDVFTSQVKVAGRCGCSGFMAGRSVWADAVTRPLDEMESALTELSRGRFETLRQTARDNCQSVDLSAIISDSIEAEWYRAY